MNANFASDGGKSEHSVMIDDNYYLMVSIEKEKTGIMAKR